MMGKPFFRCLFILFILFILLPALHFQAKGEDDLFSKIKITVIKGNKKAPDFSLNDLEGKTVGLKEFKGKIVFLNFWATWCGPCKEEMPSMESLWQQFKGKDFILLAVSVDYERSIIVKEFIKKNRYTFPVLIDPKGQILDLYEVKGIPSTFLIDKRGRLIGKVIGPRDWKAPEMFSLTTKLTKR